jgi:hypothetical protein
MYRRYKTQLELLLVAWQTTSLFFGQIRDSFVVAHSQRIDTCFGVVGNKVWCQNLAHTHSERERERDCVIINVSTYAYVRTTTTTNLASETQANFLYWPQAFETCIVGFFADIHRSLNAHACVSYRATTSVSNVPTYIIGTVSVAIL